MIIVLAVLGLVFGSFLTAFTDRLHDGRDWVKGRSECDSCHKELHVRDLVPLFSWLFSKGKCRQCGKAVSVRYPLTELATASLFVVSYLAWPFVETSLGLGLPEGLAGFELVKLVFWLVVIVGFVGLSLYDLRWMILPDKIIIPLLSLVIAFTAVEAVFFGGGPELVKNAIIGLIVLGGLFYGLFQVSDGKWIGGGDVKLSFILGILAGGAYKAVLVIFLSSLLGILVAVPGLLSKKINTKSQIPFGPVLMLASVVVYLWGQNIIDWYENAFLVL